MAENKTQKTTASVGAFLDSIEDQQRRIDCKAIHKMMKEATGKTPCMGGSSIVGYGEVHYKYASGREGDWFLCGFSPRKTSLTLYMSYSLEKQKASLRRLGKHKIGKACLYINKLEDVDMDVLRQIVDNTVTWQKAPKQAPKKAT
jgi:hypothetical protein